MEFQQNGDGKPAAGGDVSPVAMTIAGSDSGGGAGIQADLRSFTYFGVFGTTVITAVTAQNPQTVRAVQALSPDTVAQQFFAVTEAIDVKAAKTGMLFGAEIIEAVADAYAASPSFPLVIDPVMVATSGATLLQKDAIAILKDRLLPQAAVLTPNIPEAELLLGRPLTTFPELCCAARELAQQYTCTVIVKGGHHKGLLGTDAASDGIDVWKLAAPALAPHTTHGTGCALSAAVTACLAQGDNTLTALQKAKAYVHGILQNCCRIGKGSWAAVSSGPLPLDQITCVQVFE